MSSGSVGFMMHLDGRQYGIPKQYRQDVKMKDHIKENVKRMRQIQRNCKERDHESKAQPMKALWKSEKYSDVPSKIKADQEREPLPPRPNSAPFLRAHSRSGPSVKDETRSRTPDFTHKLSVPAATSTESVNLVHHDIDFIKHNGRLSRSGRIAKSPSLTHLDNLKKKQDEDLQAHPVGQVPKYLRSRQHQWKREEEERILNTPDPAMPPGHRLLPEKERQDTLHILKTNENALIEQLQALPLRMDTLRIRTKKLELENKITEIEEAIKIFSRPKVFVKSDQ